jgi:addiction module RelE/StbE family toxin
MNRPLLRSSAFVRAAKKVVKRTPASAADIQAAIELLQADAFDPRLRTHKLSGELAGSWACSAGYDLRIIFSFIQHDQGEAILLETLGTHDEVY